jgi:hypothetical protein
VVLMVLLHPLAAAAIRNIQVAAVVLRICLS